MLHEVPYKKLQTNLLCNPIIEDVGIKIYIELLAKMKKLESNLPFYLKQLKPDKICKKTVLRH